MSGNDTLSELGQEIIYHYSPSYVTLNFLFMVHALTLMQVNNLLCSTLRSRSILFLSPNYFIFANELTVLVFYDYFLTLPVELSLIWTGKVTLMKALFFVNRYSFMVGWIFNAISSVIETRDIKVRTMCFYSKYYHPLT